MSLINYQGDSKLLKRICALLNVKDVQDGQGHSLVDENGVAIVSGGGGGSSTLAGLSDVDTTGVTAGDALCYNGTSQKWEDKTLATVAVSGSYSDLSNTPTIPAAQVNSDWDAVSGVAQILNKPSLAAVATSGSYSDLSNTPTIPDELADLSDDSTHRVVTDTEKSAWSAKVDDNPTFSEASTRANIASGESFATILGKIMKFFTDLKTVAFSGSYSDLTNKPTIPAAQVNSDWNSSSGVSEILNKPSLATVATSGSYNDLTNKPTIPAAQVNSDWTASSGVSQILNKPSLAAVATSGSYSDLSNKPTIPSKTSDITNDSGFITDSVTNFTITNALNNLPPNTYKGIIGSGDTILSRFTSQQAGVALYLTQNADDSPTKGIVSATMVCKCTNNGTYSFAYHFNQGGQISYTSTGSSLPSSLTWKRVVKPDWTTSGNWHYYRDAQDVYHLHFRTSESINYNGTIGNLKYRNTTYNINFPVTLSNIYSINVTTGMDSDIGGATVHSFNNTQVKLWLWASSSGSKTTQINIDVVST